MSCETRSLTLDLLAFDFLEGRERDRIARHADACPDCRASIDERREEREIVALVLALEPAPAVPPVPVAAPRPVSPAAFVVAVAAAVLLLVLGPSLLLPRYDAPPVRRVEERSPEAGREVPIEPLLSPDLSARVRELEARVEQLLAAAPDPDRPLPSDPRKAIAGYDWDGLASALLVVNPTLVEGRVPADPQVMVRYAESLRELVRVAESAGIDGDLTAVSRDPRTGPLLFGAVVRRAWPEVAPADVAVAEEAARDAMTDYGSEVARATNSASTAAAEERLAEALTEEVERIEERYGEPEVEVAPVVPVSTRATDPKEVRESVLRKDSQVLVSAMGVGVARDRVVQGTAEVVSRDIAVLLAADLDVPAADLAAVTGQWVVDYRAKLESAPKDVRAAFEAGLRGDPAETDVAASLVRRLRSALLDVQSTAEDRLLRVLDREVGDRLRKVSRPTFFLIETTAARAQSLGNSIR